MAATGGRCWLVAAVLLCSTGAAQTSRDASRPSQRGLTPLERSVLAALATDPTTAPYPIRTELRDGQLVLHGRVATHAIHVQAIQTALAFTPAIRDELVIDTAEVGRAFSGRGDAMPRQVAPDAAQRAAWPAVTTYSSPPYYYPPPLFGRVDEPFYGFEPPLLSYPAWWGVMSRRRVNEPPASNFPGAGRGPAANLPTLSRDVEIDVDDAGRATVSGRVGSERERTAILDRIGSLPGISGVVDRLELDPTLLSGGSASTEAPPAAQSSPVPPPPAPGLPAAEAGQGTKTRGADQPRPSPNPHPADPHKVEPGKTGDSAEGASLEIRGGVAYLTGRVASLAEAMDYYLQAKRTPGVESVDDRLEVRLPKDRDENPLLRVAATDDLAEYLGAQIVRHVGKSLAIDRLEVDGRRLSIHGRATAESQPRIEAALRSMAVLRGFDVRTQLTLIGTDS